MDVLLPRRGPKVSASAPLLLLVPRPKHGLDPVYGVAFQLNQRMVARVFEQRSGRSLLPDEDIGDQKPWQVAFRGPFIQTSTQPLKRGRKGLKDAPGSDFKARKGGS